MAALALALSMISLGLGVFLFAVCRKLIEANQLAGEALEHIANLLEARQ